MECLKLKSNPMTKQQLTTHAYSFLKTYITVFLTLYLYGVENGKDMFDLFFIAEAAKFSLLSVIRNVYKMLTEK